MLFATGLQQVFQGRDIGIKAHAYILQVINNYVYIFELLGFRFFIISVQGDHRQTGTAVGAAFDMCSRIGIAPESMLGREDGYNLNPLTQ
ncbi:hypothetical protein D9M68_825850 [compost metagenome]